MKPLTSKLYFYGLLVSMCAYANAIDVGKYWKGIEVNEAALTSNGGNVLHAPKLLAASLAYAEARKKLSDYDLVFHLVRVFSISQNRFVVVFDVPVAPCDTCTWNRKTLKPYEVNLDGMEVFEIEPADFSYADYKLEFSDNAQLDAQLTNASFVYAPLIPALAVSLTEFMKTCPQACISNFVATWKEKEDGLQIFFAAFSNDKSSISYDQYAEYWVRRSTTKLLESKTKLVGMSEQ